MMLSFLFLTCAKLSGRRQIGFLFLFFFSLTSCCIYFLQKYKKMPSGKSKSDTTNVLQDSWDFGMVVRQKNRIWRKDAIETFLRIKYDTTEVVMICLKTCSQIQNFEPNTCRTYLKIVHRPKTAPVCQASIRTQLKFCMNFHDRNKGFQVSVGLCCS